MKRCWFWLLALGSGCDPQFVDAVGVAAVADAGPPVVEPLLLHRYSFDGSSTDVIDSRGAAHGVVVNTTLTNDGTLTLAGGSSGEYVDLPDGIVSGLSNATFEAWVIWEGGSQWQRIFDFGNTAPNGSGTSYLFLTPSGVNLNGPIRLVHSTGGTVGETALNGPGPMPTGQYCHVAAVIDEREQTMSLYMNGELLGSTAFTNRLSDIDDVNNWLGRSNFPADQNFAGILDEFRIYASALSAEQIATSFAAGPDAKLVGEP